jgi:hypothetical protein
MRTELKRLDASLRGAAVHRGFITRALAIAAACSAFVLPSSTSERANAQSNTNQTFTIHVAPGVSVPWLRRSEKAIGQQSLTVRARWGTPLVRFGSGGWTVFIHRGRYSDNPPGWHGVHDGHPYAVVETGTWAPAAGIFDHELLEMLVDPYARHVIRGRRAEICDPVLGHRYPASDGGLLVDWVYPAYFRGSKVGPWDYLRLLTSGA